MTKEIAAARVTTRLLTVACGAGIAYLQPAPVWADDDALAEVVVTAQHRTESLQDVPISIGTLSGQQLADFGADGFETYALRIPGLQVFNAGNDDTQLQMRGIVTSIDQDQSPQTSPTIGLYLDDLYTALSAANPNFVLEDMERVEVLRGPQGTLYGAGSEAGTIRYITRKPELDTWGAQISGEGGAVTGGTPDWHESAVLNAPLVDGVAAARVLTYYREDGGFLDNPILHLNDTNSEATYGGRGEVLVKPAPDISLLLLATFQNQRENDNDFYNDEPGYGFPLRTTYALEPQTGNSRIVSLTVDWSLPTLTLTSVSGYQSNYQDANLEVGLFPQTLGAPPGPYNGLVVPTLGHVWAESQEFRLRSEEATWGNYVVGTYFSNQMRKTTQTADAPGIEALVPGLPSGPSEGTITDRLYDSYFAVYTKQYAVFAAVTWKITPALLLSGGLRWYDYDQDSHNRAAGILNGGVTLVDSSFSQNGTSPRVNLAYHLDPDQMVYATASRGFRLGGVNGAVPESLCELSAPAPAFKSDSLWNYELGAKTSWDDRKLTVDGDVFYIDFKNFQTQTTIPACGDALIQNAGTLISKGAELELTARPVAPLLLSFGATYTDSTLDNDVSKIGLAGDRAPYVPRVSLNVGADYSAPLTAGITGFVGVDAQHVGARVTAFSQEIYYATLPAYTMVNARIGIQRGPVRVALFGANLGNSEPLIFQNLYQFSTMTQLQTATLRPRTIGLRFTYTIL